MTRRLVIHNHFARDVGRAVSPEDEERARAASYASTGISRDGNLPPGFTIVPGKYPGQLSLMHGGQLKAASSNRAELEELAAGIAKKIATGSRDGGSLAIRTNETLLAQVNTMLRLAGKPELPTNTPRAKIEEAYRRESRARDSLPVNSTGKSASEWSAIMADLRDKKPHPVNKLWNNLASAPPAEVAAAEQRIRTWNSEYSKASKMQKKALEEDNENFRKSQGRANDAMVSGKLVKVGDYVGFKSDYEQYGKITAINGDKLTLYNPEGFGGEYLRYAKTTVERASDCWL